MSALRRLEVILRTLAGQLQMPPGQKLSAAEVAGLEAWVKMGAPDPRGGEPAAAKGADLWSLRPVRDPPPPAVRDSSWSLNPVDRFILAQLEGAGLAPAPPPRVPTWSFHVRSIDW